MKINHCLLKELLLAVIAISIIFILFGVNGDDESSRPINERPHYALTETVFPHADVIEGGGHYFYDKAACAYISKYTHGESTVASALAPLRMPRTAFTGTFKQFLYHMKGELDKVVPECAYVANGDIVYDMIANDEGTRNEFDMLIHSYATLRGKYLEERISYLRSDSYAMVKESMVPMFNAVESTIPDLGLVYSDFNARCIDQWVRYSPNVTPIINDRLYVKRRDGTVKVMHVLDGSEDNSVVREALMSCSDVKATQLSDTRSDVEVLESELANLNNFRAYVLKTLDEGLANE